MKECLPLMLGIEGTTLSARERELFAQLQAGGYILFSRNIESADECRELCDELRSISRFSHPPIIAIDQEGGRVIRTAALGLQLPSASALALCGDSKLIIEAAQLNAQALLSLGINTNFAPVLDAQKMHSNALTDRCWGSDIQDIISFAGMWNREHIRQGVMSCGKHFPGMGEARVDPHFNLPLLKGDKDHFLQSPAIPFLTLMPELPSLMMAHLQLADLDAKLPSSLSPHIVGDFLRLQLGYEGLIFTDDLCMGAIANSYPPEQSAALALKAGCDMPLLCHDVVEQLERVAESIHHLPRDITAQAVQRIERFANKCQKRAAMPYVAWQEHLQACRDLCLRCPEEGSSSRPAAQASSPVQAY